MSLLSSRHRKLLFAAAALAASGYASYHIYTSTAFACQRKRLLQILSTLGFCCEALSQSAESFSILSCDLKAFLTSDDDVVPQSLKQAFKIGQCEEFQEAVTVLSSALARGLWQGITEKPRKEALVRGHVHGRFFKQGWQGNDTNVGSEDVGCREIREVTFTTKGQKQCCRMHGLQECMSCPSAEKGGYDRQEWEIKSCSSGSDMHVQHSRRADIVFDKLKRTKSFEDLLEKLVSKLFSKSGVSFASTVTGTLAKNLVWAYFDARHNQISFSKISGSCSSSNRQRTTYPTEEEGGSTYAKVIDALHSDPCRTLIAECMQTFISTAVAVYIDKTKDVNFCDDMVASITNPFHKDSMKEVLTTICNSAVETLVRTSYDVLRDRQGEVAECHEQAGSKRNIQGCSSFTAINGQLLCSTKVDQEKGADRQRGALSRYDRLDSRASSCTMTIGVSQGKEVQSFIDGVSKTLAIPSNRKLIVDVAGTMTSEAVRSLMNVVMSTASSHICSKLHGSWGMLRNSLSNHQDVQLQERSRHMAAKAFVFASICLAICLHVIAGSQFLRT